MVAALSAVQVYGQTPNRTPNRAAGPRTSIDDPRVQVREIEIQPHERSAEQEHSVNEVLVFRQAGQMTRTMAGKTETLEFSAGEPRWDPAGAPYVLENTTDHAIDFVEVKLHNTPMEPPIPLTNLDMLVSDPEHYKFVFENDQVRVLSVHYGPQEQGGLHQHVRTRIIVNLSADLRAKYGDVGLMEPETHQEKNNTDTAVDRIAIELK